MAEAEVFDPWNDADAVPLIRIDSVTKRFGGFTAIDDISLDIYPQEFFALLGPSGCGKTTLMRMLAGFETPSEGHLIIDGQDMAGVAPNKRAVNMMFQSYALFPHLSVWDNIAFGLKRDKLSKDQIAARVDEMLKLTQLGQFARRSLTRFPVANVNGWLWPGLWRRLRSCCCWTNPLARSTRSCVRKLSSS